MFSLLAVNSNLLNWVFRVKLSFHPFSRYVVLKLILFEFVNTFLSLFYIAFYLQDVTMLKSQVFTMLIVIQIVNQVQFANGLKSSDVSNYEQIWNGFSFSH